MRVLISGGRVLDQTGERVADVLVDDGRISAVGDDLGDADRAESFARSGTRSAHTVLDATGCVVAPGFVDLHTHLREPGKEEAETIETGSRAAALGGYTAVVAMPNTDPAQDSRGVVDFVRAQGEAAGLCEVLPSGCITVGRAGELLAPYHELVAAGVRIFTDDGNGVQDPLLMRRAMEYSRGLDMVLAQHCEVARLTVGAVMHEGHCCSELGLPGWPAIAEELMVHRDIELSRLTGARIHLALTDEALRGYDPVFKVNPPLRTADDIAALKAGLADGTIDAIATDHAPHPVEDKERPIDDAPPGMLGLETALGVALAVLDLPLAAVVAALSWQPAAIAGVSDRHGTPIAPENPANLVVFDPDERWQVRPAALASRSRNTPFVGLELRGKVRHTVFRGDPVVIDGVATR